jgi:hypothetical protein
MYYENLIHDFANRTLANLDTLKRVKASGEHGPVYEVTQLVNSLLGLLVFPQQKFVEAIPQRTIAELEAEGWPIPKVSANFQQARDLRELVRYLRNAIAHCNVEFTVNDRDEIDGISLWNEKIDDNKRKQINWKAKLLVIELERIVEKFIALVLSSHPKK